MTDYVESLTDEDMTQMMGVGSVMKVFGTILEKDFERRFGILLDAGERKENGGKPSHTANPVIDIEIPGVACFMLRPTDTNNKTRGNGWAKDVGLSDKVKTGNVPPTLMIEILVDKIATMLGGNIRDKALADLQSALRGCMTIDEGKFTFDKKKAPPLNHPIEVAEFLSELKQEFVGTTAGANHVSMEIIPIPIESNSPTTVSLEGDPDVLSASHPDRQEEEAHYDNQHGEESPDSQSGTSFIDAQADILLFGE